MPFAIDTISGQREVVKSFEKHYAALREIKFSIDNRRPVQCVKAMDQAKTKKRKKRRSRKPKNNDWVHKTKKRVQQIKNGGRGAVDNTEPTSGKGLSEMITSARRRREEVKRKEHAHRIRKMRRNMSESHSLSQRRKNYFDAVANPVVLFRRKRRPSTAHRGQPECLQASSNFLGAREVISRPQTARRPRSKIRGKSRRPKSAGARHRSRQRDQFDLVNDDVISFQNKIVQTIVKKRMCKEEDVLNYLVDEISDHLFLDEEDLLAVARYVCNEFSVGIHKLHLLLSLKLQVHLDGDEVEKQPKTGRRKEGKAVNIPRPTNDETKEVIIASPKKSIETENTEVNQDKENENNV